MAQSFSGQKLGMKFSPEKRFCFVLNVDSSPLAESLPPPSSLLIWPFPAPVPQDLRRPARGSWPLPLPLVNKGPTPWARHRGGGGGGHAPGVEVLLCLAWSGPDWRGPRHLLPPFILGRTLSSASVEGSSGRVRSRVWGTEVWNIPLGGAAVGCGEAGWVGLRGGEGKARQGNPFGPHSLQTQHHVCLCVSR